MRNYLTLKNYKDIVSNFIQTCVSPCLMKYNSKENDPPVQRFNTYQTSSRLAHQLTL